MSKYIDTDNDDEKDVKDLPIPFVETRRGTEITRTFIKPQTVFPALQVQIGHYEQRPERIPEYGPSVDGVRRPISYRNGTRLVRVFRLDGFGCNERDARSRMPASAYIHQAAIPGVSVVYEDPTKPQPPEEQDAV